MSEYYAASASPAINASLSSATIRNEFSLLSAGFDLLPTLAGNGSKIVQVNSGGTALTASATLTNVTLAGTLTISAATRTISANFVETRAVGATAAGTHYINDHLITLTADAGGTSTPIGHRFGMTASGAEAFNQPVAHEARFTYTGSVTAAAGYATQGAVFHSGTGAITNVFVIRSYLELTSTGSITAANMFSAHFPVFGSTGAITTLRGFQARDIGHATLVTNSISFDAENHTASLTLNAAFRGQMTSGTNKYNLYMSGTAANLFNGDLSIYAGTAIPAGGTAGSGYKFSSTANYGVFFGSGSPTLSAAKGSLYLRSDGSGATNRAYINSDGGSTWTALTTAA